MKMRRFIELMIAMAILSVVAAIVINFWQQGEINSRIRFTQAQLSRWRDNLSSADFVKTDKYGVEIYRVSEMRDESDVIIITNCDGLNKWVNRKDLWPKNWERFVQENSK